MTPRSIDKTGMLTLALTALALGGCKGDPPPAAPDAAPVDAAPPPPVDAAPADAAPIDATTDAYVFTGETTVLKIAVPKPRGDGAATPRNRPTPAAPSGARVSIMGTITKHQNEVVDCYARVAEKNPAVAGQLTMAWTLGPDGRPTMTSVARNTLGDASVGECVKQRSAKWQFPKPSSGTPIVKYTWTLRLQ